MSCEGSIISLLLHWPRSRFGELFIFDKFHSPGITPLQKLVSLSPLYVTRNSRFNRTCLCVSKLFYLISPVLTGKNITWFFFFFRCSSPYIFSHGRCALLAVVITTESKSNTQIGSPSFLPLAYLSSEKSCPSVCLSVRPCI